MDKKTRIFFTIFFVVWCGAFLVGASFMASDSRTFDGYQYGHSSKDYADIVKVDYNAELMPDGRLIVAETLHFDIKAAHEDNPFRELYREFTGGIGESMTDIRVVEHTSNGNVEYKNTEDSLDENPSFQNLRTPGTFSFLEASTGIHEIQWYINVAIGKPVYTIYYTYHNAVDVYKDAVQLYLKLFSGGAIDYLNEYNATITLPEGLTSDSGFKLYAHNQDKATTAIDGDKIKLSIKNPKGNVHETYGFIEIRAIMDESALAVFGNPNNVSTQNAYTNLVNEEEDWATAKAEAIRKENGWMIADIVIAALAVLGTLVVAYLLNKKTPSYKLPQKYVRDIPDKSIEPAVAAHLLNAKWIINGNAIASAMLSLIIKGAITIEKIDPNKDFKPRNCIIKPKNLDVPLRYYENSLLTNLRQARLVEIGGLTFKMLKKFNSLQKKSPLTAGFNASLDASGFFKQPREDRIESKMKAEAIAQIKREKLKKRIIKILIFALGIVASFVWAIVGAKYGKTPYGFVLISPFLVLIGTLFVGINFGFAKPLPPTAAEALPHWYGFYRFLKDLTRLSESELPEIEKWEEYLTYATAFGVNKKLLKVLEKMPTSQSSSSLSHLGGSAPAIIGLSKTISKASGSFTGSSGSSGGGSGGGGGGRSGGGGGGRGGGGGGGRH